MKRLTRESAPQRTARTATAISTDANNACEIAQVEKLLELFAKISIPDLWFYGNDLQRKTEWQQPRVPYSPEFGKEVLDFWHLAHELQRALQARAKEAQP